MNARSVPTGGNPKTGAYRTQFLLESVLDLKRQLRSVGSDLLIAMGKPEEVGGPLAPATKAPCDVLAKRCCHACWPP